MDVTDRYSDNAGRRFQFGGSYSGTEVVINSRKGGMGVMRWQVRLGMSTASQVVLQYSKSDLCTYSVYSTLLLSRTYGSGVMAQVRRLLISSSITQTRTITMDSFLDLDRGIN